MTGSRPNIYFIVSWMVTCPLALVVIIIGSLYSLFSKVPKYNVWMPELGAKLEIDYPSWAYVLIVILVLIAASCIPITAICRKLKLCKPEHWVQYRTSNPMDKKDLPDCAVTESTQPLTANV